MRKVILSIFMLLSAMSANAQNAYSSSMLEKNRHDIPETGTCIVEGNVTNVPDGTVVNFWFPENGDYIGEAIAKINKGKFHFKKKIRENTRYIITLGNDSKELPFLAALGTTKITGDNADCSLWRVENQNPAVIEETAYMDRRNAISEEFKKKEEESKKQKKEAQIDIYAEEHFYFNSMYEFMKGRPYSSTYKKELTKLIRNTPYLWNDPQKRVYEKRLRELCLKIPFNEVAEYQNLFTRKVLNVGDYLIDFMLYDHDGKEHHLEEFSSNNKYLLMEFCCKEDKDMMKTRPENVLDDLYQNYSATLDIVTINCDAEDAWMSGRLPRDKWNEWNDHKNSLAVMMEYSTMFRYVFISPENKIIGFGRHEDLKDKVKQHFAFVK